MAQPALLIARSSLADVDECLTGQAMCAHQCLNTRGSFKCTCNPGYELGADGKQCYREYRVRPSRSGGHGGQVCVCRLAKGSGDPCSWAVFVHCPLGVGGAEL